MPNEVYVITGATGNIGSRIIEKLLASKQKVRAIARKADKLRTFRGVEAFPASLDDTGSITRAFTGAKAVFTMIPPNPQAPNLRSWQNRISQVFAASITGAGVRNVVNLSSVGAHIGSKTGPVNGLYDLEQRLNKLDGVNVLHLRPAFFMENHLGSLEMIKKMGVNGGGLQADLPIPMIATADIADEASERLLKMDFIGKQVRELLGPKEYSMKEITAVIGQVLQKQDLKYTQFSYDDVQKYMLGLGMSPDVAAQMIEMIKGLNEKVMKPSEARNGKNTTPTTFQQFARDVLAAKAAAAMKTTKAVKTTKNKKAK